MRDAAKRFQTLDGLRAVAASAVLLFHMHYSWPRVWSPGSAYLVVDLFFMISGFVLAAAYSDKLDRGLTAQTFLLERLLRLWPLYLVGLGLAAIPITVTVLHGHASISTLRPLFAAVFYCPWPGADGALYPPNIPAWSLLYEWLANIVMVVAWRWLSNRMLVIIAGLSAIGLIVSSLSLGSLNAGFTAISAPTAIARIGFSFPVGILLWRAKGCGLKLSAWIPISAMVVIIAPDFAAHELLDPLIVLAAWPLVVWLAADTTPDAASAVMFEATGAASYALYAIHAPALVLILAILNHRGPTLFVEILIFVGLWAAASLLGFFDQHLRHPRWSLGFQRYDYPTART